MIPLDAHSVSILSRHFCDALTTLGVFAAMPTLIVWLITRAKSRQLEKRAEIAKLAMEKYSHLDLETTDELLARLNPPTKTAAEKNFSRLTAACILIFLGLGLGAVCLFTNNLGIDSVDLLPILFIGGGAACIFAGLGLGFLVSYLVIKRKIAKGEVK